VTPFIAQDNFRLVHCTTHVQFLKFLSKKLIKTGQKKNENDHKQPQRGKAATDTKTTPHKGAFKL
jgi:hypothetical protein